MARYTDTDNTRAPTLNLMFCPSRQASLGLYVPNLSVVDDAIRERKLKTEFIRISTRSRVCSFEPKSRENYITSSSSRARYFSIESPAREFSPQRAEERKLRLRERAAKKFFIRDRDVAALFSFATWRSRSPFLRRYIT